MYAINIIINKYIINNYNIIYNYKINIDNYYKLKSIHFLSRCCIYKRIA